MNTVTMTSRKDPPPCYGKDWDKAVPECAGGPDASYTHPKSGLHMREQCDFFSSCGVRVGASRVIPADRLIRPPLVTPQPQPQAQAPAPQGPQSFHDYLRAEQAKHVEAARVQAMTGVRPAVPTMAVPQGMHYAAPNYHVPGYLTTPEVRRPGESLFVVALLEAGRGAFKGFFHAASHAFDVRPFREK